MPRIGIRIQPVTGFGTANFQSPRPFLQPTTLNPGPGQAREQFNEPGIPATVARALNQIQENIHQSTQQAKGSPSGGGNLLRGVILTNGGTNGANPNVIAHGLGIAYTGYKIHAIYNGSIDKYATIAPSTAFPANRVLLLWTQVTAFPNQNVSCDIEIYP